MNAAGRPGGAPPGQALPGGAPPGQAAPGQPLPGGAATGWAAARRRLAGHPALRDLAVFAGYLAAGVAATWPRASYLAGHRLPATRDTGSYVWCFWWVAHQIIHLGSPWFTRYLAAPVGAQLGLHVLMPLESAAMTPVTLLFGPSASYNLLSAAMPGCLCYAAYRVARLWLPSRAGALAAGAFFGLSSMLGWRSWYHLNLAAGAVFLPLAAEAAVRLRRRPGRRQAVILGLVLAGCLLTDQESTVLAAIVAALVLLPWLARRPGWAAGRAVVLAGLVAVALGGPQLAAVAAQLAAGGSGTSAQVLGQSYLRYGTPLAGLVAPSPRVADAGLTRLASYYYRDGAVRQVIGRQYSLTSEPVPLFGVVLATLALAGLALSWRRRSAWLLALLWATAAALALGPVLWIGTHAYVPAALAVDGVRVSGLLPYTWFVRVPGLSGFREAGRLAELGLLPAALLAGAAVGWLRQHALPALAVVLAAGALEAGWPGSLPGGVIPPAYRIGTMPTAMQALDRPIAADHSGSIVVDFPFGICGGTGTYGAQFRPQAQVLATADGHPRAVAFIARVPQQTTAGVAGHPFYAGLVREWSAGPRFSTAELAAARHDARAMRVGWVLVWPQRQKRAGKQVTYWNQGVIAYLRQAGFVFGYRADGVLVYRAGPAGQAAPAGPATPGRSGHGASSRAGEATGGPPGRL